MHGDDLAELGREKLLRLSLLQTDVIESGLDYEHLKWLIAREVHSATDASGAVVEVHEAGDMVYEAVSGVDKSLVGMRLSASGSLSGLAIRDKDTLSCTDCRTDPRVDRTACERVGLRSMIVTPLLYNNIPLGVLKALSSQPDFFTGEDAALMRVLSRILSAALYHSRRQSKTELYQRATRDWLTGLANRGLFEDRAQHEIAQANRNGRRVGIFIIDINQFKAINDSYGHKFGDGVLRETASRIKQCIRHSDTAARFGGDEFALLMTNVESVDECVAIKKRLGEAFKPAFSIDGKTLEMSISSGFSVSTNSETTLDVLLNQADKAMYAEKHGHNVYDPGCVPEKKT